MPSYLSRLACCLCLLWLASCSDKDGGSEYPYERTVLELSASKRCADHAAKPGEPCYLLKWRHPIERAKLLRYHIWVDTLVVGDTTLDVPDGALESSIKVDYVEGRGNFDSLDLTSLLGAYQDRDSLHVAIWAEYGDGGDPGAIQRLYLFFGDDLGPSRVSFSDSSNQRSVWLDWTRPTDQVDFYFPDFISGPIAGYNLHLYAADETEDLRGATVELLTADGREVASGDSSRWKRGYRLRQAGDSLLLDAVVPDGSVNHLRVAILDGRGFHTVADSNHFRVRIGGLNPEHSYSVSLVAYDSAGNRSAGDAEVGSKVMTTDTVAPLMAKKLWLRSDSVDGAKPRLDSNRLVLYWPRSVDPLTPKSNIQLDSTLRLPDQCALGSCYREVASYKVELWKNGAWESARRAGGLVSEKYQDRYARSGDSMVYALDGMYVSDTLRWMAPGDTVIVRIRAVDVSGHISAALVDTVMLSRGPLYSVDCPSGYVPVRRSYAENGVAKVETYCMEKFEHRQGDSLFVHDVLYGDARSSCQALSGSAGFSGFSVDLCDELSWKNACTAGNRVEYGTIEESPFTPLEYLFQNCNVGTQDSISALSMGQRNRFCLSPDGVRDLPGQLQEWAVGTVKTYDSTAKAYRVDTIPVLKGTSYVYFEGALRTDLAECAGRARPYRLRPAYAQDTVWLYRSGSTVDTSFTRDTSRTLYVALPPKSFKDTLLFYVIRHPVTGDSLGLDYVDQAEYRRRGGEAWLSVLWTGLKYELKEKRQVLIRGTRKENGAAFFYKEPSIGFRCCARARS